MFNLELKFHHELLNNIIWSYLFRTVKVTLVGNWINILDQQYLHIVKKEKKLCWFINLYLVKTTFICSQIEENKLYILHLKRTPVVLTTRC